MNEHGWGPLTGNMISGVGSIAVLVTHAGKSAEWYRDKLDFEIVESNGHAVFVRPKGSKVLLHLCAKCKGWDGDMPGGRTGIWLTCGKLRTRRDKKSGVLIPSSDPAEVERTYRALRRKRVEFAEKLTTTSWGKYAILKDPDGNEFELS